MVTTTGVVPATSSAAAWRSMRRPVIYWRRPAPGAVRVSATDYLEITFSVPERRYSAWPPAMRDGFAAARTLRTGRPTFCLTLNEEDK